MALIWSNTGRQSPEPYNTVYIVWWLLFKNLIKSLNLLKKEEKKICFLKKNLTEKTIKYCMEGARGKIIRYADSVKEERGFMHFPGFLLILWKV